MRTALYPVLAILAILVGLGAGYLWWGVQVADLNRQLQEQRSDLNYRIGELEKRVKESEGRANQEAATRKVLEDQLHRVSPLK